jgi:hypothetical protein
MVTAAVDKQQQQQLGGDNRSKKCMPGTEDSCCALRGSNDKGLELKDQTDWKALKFDRNGFKFDKDAGACGEDAGEQAKYATLYHCLQNDHASIREEGFCFRDEYDAYH